MRLLTHHPAFGPVVETIKSVFDGQLKMCITDHSDIIKNVNCSVEIRNFYFKVPLVTAFAGYLSNKNDHHIVVGLLLKG